ncbi:MAG: cupin domain-containing protein [Candidatus Binatia bacterium]
MKVCLKILLTVLLGYLLACAPQPHFYLKYGDRLTESDLARVLADNPLSSSRNLRVVTLGKGKGTSHHVVQIRYRETPHIHRNHDLTVVVLKGAGYLTLDKKRFNLRKGDVLFIPRGAVHYFVNTYYKPSVALAIFSPPFDGKDTIPVPVR